MSDYTRAPRVLVVEDDEDIAQALQRSLRMEGYEVRSAADGKAALEHGRTFAPDLVILDLGLPEIDGIEVARRLRDGDDVPILILTARDALESRVEGLDAVILQRAAEDKTIIVFPVRAGLLAEPIFLRFAELSSQPRSVEAILRKELEPQTNLDERVPAPGPPPDSPQAAASSAPSEPADFRARYGLQAAPAELAEHLSLLARWFYSKPREGEIFFREADWPYRRILRACARLLGPAETSQIGAQPSS